MKRHTQSPIILMLSVLIILATPLISEAGYVIENELNDSYLLAQNLDPYFTYGTNQVIEIDSTGTLSDFSASVYGLSGDSTYDYYSFSVGTGSSPLMTNTLVVFDIDFAYINWVDTFLTLFDTDGTTLLAYNDDTSFNGPGDMTSPSLNSFISYTFTTAGTYYIRVSEFNEQAPPYGDVLSTDGNYQLHVSSISTIPVPSSLLLMIPGLLGYIRIRHKF